VLDKFTAIAQGGTAPYTYQILPAASPILQHILVGLLLIHFECRVWNYMAYVKMLTIVLFFAITLGLDPTTCCGCGGETNQLLHYREGNFAIDVTLPTAGVGPAYSYSIDGGAFKIRAAPFTVVNLSDTYCSE
jgi:hypothetical protein